VVLDITSKPPADRWSDSGLAFTPPYERPRFAYDVRSRANRSVAGQRGLLTPWHLHGTLRSEADHRERIGCSWTPTGKTLGRLRRRIADVRAAEQPEYTPHIDTGTRGRGHAEKIHVSGNKRADKRYYRTLRYTRAACARAVERCGRRPERSSVRRTRDDAPNRLARKQNKLKIYAGPDTRTSLRTATSGD